MKYWTYGLTLLNTCLSITNLTFIIDIQNGQQRSIKRNGRN